MILSGRDGVPKAHPVYTRDKKIIIVSYVPVISSNVGYAELSKQEKQNSRIMYTFRSLTARLAIYW